MIARFRRWLYREPYHVWAGEYHFRLMKITGTMY